MSVSALAQDGWKEYPFPEDGFSISAPAKPAFAKESTETAIGPLEQHTYQVQLGADSGLMINTTDFKQGDSLPLKKLLEAGMNGAAENSKSTASKEKDVSLEGNAGIEFELANETFHARVQLFFVNGKMLTVMAAAPAAKPIPAEADRFFSSLKLIKKPASIAASRLFADNRWMDFRIE
jgi:hypothetical protein